ncbi:MAG: ClcB-like voltage-gated chloride channel protein [Sulfuriferula sp.]
MSAGKLSQALTRFRSLLRGSPHEETHRMLLGAGFIGILGALATVGFREGITLVEALINRHPGSLVAAAEAITWWQRLLIPLLGGLLAGAVLQFGMRLIQHGSKTTDYMEAIAAGNGRISVRASLVKSLSSIFTVGTGGSIGREGAMVQLAAMVASASGHWAHLPLDKQRLLVGCGAAAGIAAAYNAPIAGALFVAEIVMGSIAMESFGPLIVASVVSNATIHHFLGYAPVYQIPAFQFYSDWELFFYAGLGFLLGHMAPPFIALLERSEQFFTRMKLPVTLKLGVGGLSVGLISIAYPQVWGNGYSVVNSLLHQNIAWQLLVLILVFKIIATAATIGSGAVGGVFTPTLFIGATFGSLYGTALGAVFPAVTSPASAYGIVGMGAFLAATTHAPLMAILMIFEMTLDYNITLPLMLACVIAYTTARVYRGGESIYAVSLRQKHSLSVDAVTTKTE